MIIEQQTIIISSDDEDEVEVGVSTDSQEPESRPGMVSGGGHGASGAERKTLLGYFLHDSLRPTDCHCWYRWENSSCENSSCENSCTWFLCTSGEGNKLIQGQWGNFDPTLSFIGSDVDIVGSCNGFLLCRANPSQNKGSILYLQNMDYIVCNPVTRALRHLPRPKKPYFSTSLAFICKGENVTSFDGVEFEIVRAGNQTDREFVTSVMIETFSSRTNTWTEDCIVCDSPFRLTPLIGDPNSRPVVIEEMIFWCAHSSDSYYALLVLDRSKGLRAQLVGPPPGWDGQKIGCESHHYGTSEGKLLYARYGHKNLEVWVLEDYRIRPSWVIKHRVTFTDKWLLNIQQFHPHNSNLILITIVHRPFWYDLQRKEQNSISYALFPPVRVFADGRLVDATLEYCNSRISGAHYFLYEWPASGPRPPPE